MRISDWSSDVCSSDLNALARALRTRRERGGLRRDGMTRLFHISDLHFGLEDRAALGWFADCVRAERHDAVERKSVVWGESVSVRVDLGGRRIIKKKKIEKLGRLYNNKLTD